MCGCADPRYVLVNDADYCSATNSFQRNNQLVLFLHVIVSTGSCLEQATIQFSQVRREICRCPQNCIKYVYAITYSASRCVSLHIHLMQFISECSWPASTLQVSDCLGLAPNECLQFYRCSSLITCLFRKCFCL